MIRLLGEHALTSPGPDRRWEHRLGMIERGEDSRERFMRDIAGFAEETVEELDETLKDVRIPRARLGPCPVCGHEIVENRKGYSCWAREDPGCGFVIWKSKAGKQLPLAVAARADQDRLHRQRPVTGFRGRSGRSFRARLALSQTEEGKWRVEFDEPWAEEGAKPPEADEQVADGARRRRRDGPRRPSRSARAEPTADPRTPGTSPACARMGFSADLTLITGPANAGKAQAVMDAVRRRARARRASRCWSCRRAPTSSATGASWPATGP